MDTKWKNYPYKGIDMDDLRQIYVYNDFWEAELGMLLYPSPQESKVAVRGTYEKNGRSGQIVLVNVLDGNGKLDRDLGKKVLALITESLVNLSVFCSASFNVKNFFS